VILTDEEKKKKIEINKKWLKIKEAYETLLDPERRKKYDSTFEFDDTIPDEDVEFNEGQFFRKFGPCFKKNSIWSKRKPVPKIGDINSSIEKVKLFYKFWFNFETWRDFSIEGEHNLDEASCRYEKRQMLKENKKLKSSQVKEEKVRLSKLVSVAYKNDPRVQKEEEKLKEIRDKLKFERIAQKQKEKIDEEERIKTMKKQYEENLIKQQELKIKERENLIKNVIQLAEGIGIGLSKEDVFQINLNAKAENLKQMITEITNKEQKEEKIRTFKSLSIAYLGFKLPDVNFKEDSIWKKDEINSLQKAVKKFPVGTKERWEKIGETIKTKSTNQIISMAHYLTTNPSIKIENDFDLNSVINKGSEKKIEKKIEPTTKMSDTLISNQSTQEEDMWTEEQQKQLEAALKKYPSTLAPNERWASISKDVTGKTKKQCVDRYKYLATMLKKEK